jgi:hypothetical protein
MPLKAHCLFCRYQQVSNEGLTVRFVAIDSAHLVLTLILFRKLQAVYVAQR